MLYHIAAGFEKYRRSQIQPCNQCFRGFCHLNRPGQALAMARLCRSAGRSAPERTRLCGSLIWLIAWPVQFPGSLGEKLGFRFRIVPAAKRLQCFLHFNRSPAVLIVLMNRRCVVQYRIHYSPSLLHRVFSRKRSGIAVHSLS